MGLLKWFSGRESTCNAGDSDLIPGSGRSLEEEMANFSSFLAWRIPLSEEPDGLPSMESQRVGHDWVTEHECSYIPVNVSMTKWSYYFESVFCGPTIFQHLNKFIKVQVHFSILPHLFKVVKIGSIFITIKCFEPFLKSHKNSNKLFSVDMQDRSLGGKQYKVNKKNLTRLSLTEKMRPGSNKIILQFR